MRQNIMNMLLYEVIERVRKEKMMKYETINKYDEIEI